jgi:hypothetical protein
MDKGQCAKPNNIKEPLHLHENVDKVIQHPSLKHPQLASILPAIREQELKEPLCTLATPMIIIDEV